jgi:hypothetical protein
VGCGVRRSVCALLVLGFLFHDGGEEVGGQRLLSRGGGESHSARSRNRVREEREREPRYSGGEREGHGLYF